MVLGDSNNPTPNRAICASPVWDADWNLVGQFFQPPPWDFGRDDEGALKEKLPRVGDGNGGAWEREMRIDVAEFTCLLPRCWLRRGAGQNRSREGR